MATVYNLRKPANQGRSVRPGAWVEAKTITRMRITGTGSLTVDSRDLSGAVSTGVFSGTYLAASAELETLYADSATQLKLTFPSTLTVEVL